MLDGGEMEHLFNADLDPNEDHDELSERMTKLLKSYEEKSGLIVDQQSAVMREEMRRDWLSYEYAIVGKILADVEAKWTHIIHSVPMPERREVGKVAEQEVVDWMESNMEQLAPGFRGIRELHHRSAGVANDLSTLLQGSDLYLKALMKKALDTVEVASAGGNLQRAAEILAIMKHPLFVG